MPIRDRAESFFKFAFERTATNPKLSNLHRTVKQSYQRLNQPMRVAIVGLIKAGKSTMMNALLGEIIVATGSVEATFNVNWFKYGAEPSLVVYFKDDRPPESKSFAELQDLTLRADRNRDYLLSIKYIEVNYPNDILKKFNLIDTPGLESYYEDDAQNTIDFLKLYGDELSKVTQTEATNADAVLYLFSQGLGTEDRSIVEQFIGTNIGEITPINAIGVLTKVDAYWSDPKVSNPLEAGRKICERLANNSEVRKIFYTIYPICGLLALGAKTLTSEEFEILKELAKIPQERFNSLMRNIERFRKKEYDDVSVAPTKREKVFARLGQYGVSLAYDLIHNNKISTCEELASELLAKSGLLELSQTIGSHFGNRAFLIKLNTGLRQIKLACFKESQQLQGSELQVVRELAREVEKIEAEEHSFKELQVLRSYYDRQLNLSPEEVKQLLEVTGEYGTSCGQRLGLGERALIDEMLPVVKKRISSWNWRANDDMSDDRTLEASRVLLRSYEQIAYHVNLAKKHLYFR